MNQTPSDQQPLRLTSEGEFVEPIREPRSYARVWRILRFVGLLCLLPLTLLLAFLLQLDRNWMTLIIMIAIMVGITRLWSIKPVQNWYYSLLGDVAQAPMTKRKDYKSKHYTESELSTVRNRKAYASDFFLLNPVHERFIMAQSEPIEKDTFGRGLNTPFEFLLFLMPLSGPIERDTFAGEPEGLFEFLLFLKGVITGGLGFILLWSWIHDFSVPDSPFTLIMVVIYFIGVLWGTFDLLSIIEVELKYRRLKRYGHLIFGYIVETSQSGHGRQPRVMALKYRFSAPDDREITAIRRVPADMITKLPPEDAPVAVLFANDNCYKLL